MKKTIRMAAAAIVLGTCCADDELHRVKIVKISSEIQQTPQFQVNGVADKGVDPRYWLEIEAELEVETRLKSGFIPEITAKWFAVVLDKSEKTKGKNKPVRLLGEVQFKNIRTKGKKAVISAYVDPDTLERLTGKHKPSDNDIESIALVIEGNGITKRKEHAKGLFKATTKQETGWWQKWKDQSLENAIVAKSKTPFASIWVHRYPLEKIER